MGLAITLEEMKAIMPFMEVMNKSQGTLPGDLIVHAQIVNLETDKQWAYIGWDDHGDFGYVISDEIMYGEFTRDELIDMRNIILESRNNNDRAKELYDRITKVLGDE